MGFDIWSCDSRLVVIWRADGGRRKRWRWYCSRQASATLLAGCRAVWRQVLAAAGLSGGNWLLQGRCTGPSFNGAAVKYFLLSSSILFSSSMVSNKDRNDGRCRSLWRRLAAAGPSGGRFWPLQVSLAAIGCCRAVARPLHSPLF